MTETNTTLTPTQSLALRRFIEALKADDSLYNAFPEAIRGCIADICLGGYSTAEQTIMDLEAALEADMRIFENLAVKIKSLEAEVERWKKNHMLPMLTNAGEIRPLEEMESEIIRFAISHYRGQMSEVARRLRIGRSTLYHKQARQRMNGHGNMER